MPPPQKKIHESPHPTLDYKIALTRMLDYKIMITRMLDYKIMITRMLDYNIVIFQHSSSSYANELECWNQLEGGMCDGHLVAIEKSVWHLPSRQKQ